MKRLNALVICLAMAPAYVIGTGTVLAADQEVSPDASAESSESMSQDKAYGSDGETGTAVSGQESQDGSGETMSKEQGQGNGSGDKAEMSKRPGSQFQSSDLVGKRVTSRGNGEKIGSVNDLVFSQDGRIESVIVGVGGFLGVGEKNVAVPWKGVERTLETDGKSYSITVDENAQSLEEAEAHEPAVLTVSDSSS